MKFRLCFYLFLIHLLPLASCAHQKVTRPILLDYDSYKKLEATIDKTQSNVQSALKQELIKQAKFHIPVNPPSVDQLTNTLREKLRTLIYNSTLPQLNADDEFNRLFAIADNSNHAPEEYFSTALENYFLQPDYSCTHPIYSRYFDNRYKPGLNEKDCHAMLPFSILGLGMEQEIIWIDPSRISDIHLLFTSEGDNFASSFGHVALRLVVCPEDWDTANHESCDKNLSEHLVLGFQAHIDEFSISLLKGLFGGYEARLFAFHFMDYYQINAISEFRDIYSLPLLIPPKKREELVRSLAQIHWSFAKDYTFLGNNCTSMLQAALGNLWRRMRQNEVMTSDYIRPDHFFSNMKASELTNAPLLSDLGQAEELGYYFPNTKPMYEKAFNVVKQNVTVPMLDSLSDYIDTSPRERYLYLMHDSAYHTVIEKNQYVLEAQILIEEISYIVYEKKLMSQLAMFFNENKILEKAPFLRSKLSNERYKLLDVCIMNPLRVFTGKIRSHDGIPESDKIDKLVNIYCPSIKSESDFNAIFHALESVDPSGWKPIALLYSSYRESLKNILALREFLAK